MDYKGVADLCALLFRKGFSLLKQQGRLGLIGTNSLSQGDTRLAGLAKIVADRGCIVFAKRHVKWPGSANVEVDLICIVSEGEPDERRLDDTRVDYISSRLDSEPEAEPIALRENQSLAFKGVELRGTGFILSSREAEQLIRDEPGNQECILPYLTGDDLNDSVDQSPTRYAICFFDWPYERARRLSTLLAILEQRVKPERQKVKERTDREKWWLYSRFRGELRKATQGFPRVTVRSKVSELHLLAFVSNDIICSDATVVFAFDDYFHLALLQSNIHEAWVRRNASTMRTDIRYTPTDCFETFAFPRVPSAEPRAEAERLGEKYHEHRRETMLARQLGLTKTYNLFHNPDCMDADITRLRDLHAAMDRAIIACYGWTNIDPGHGFHANERGQIRYTISPTARREILRRLLALNLDIAAREAAGEAPARRRG